MIANTLRNKQDERGNIPRTYEADLVGLLLDRYGIGYVCRHPTILFTQPDTMARGLASRVSAGHGYLAYKSTYGYVGVPDKPEESIDRMAEAYRILDQIFSPYK